MVVRCEPVPREDTEVIYQSVDQWFAAGVEGFLGTEREPRTRPETRRLLLMAAGESLLLPLEVLEHEQLGGLSVRKFIEHMKEGDNP